MPQEEEKKSPSHEFSDEESKKAAEKAMSLLLHKDRTRRELLERLYRCGFSEEASREAMEYVESFGYINDRRYTENYIMFQKGRRSRKEMIYKLSEKGVPKELVYLVMEEMEYDGEEDAIHVLIVKKLKGRPVHEISYEEKNKIIASLGRKGFELGAIKKVLSQLDKSL